MSSQRALTSPAERASAGDWKTCGCRRTSFSCTRAGDGLEIASPLLREEQRKKIDLEEQVAELVEQLLVRARERGVGDLVRLLDRVRDDRLGRLLPVPGTVAAKTLRQALQVEQRVGEAHSWTVVAPVVAGGA